MISVVYAASVMSTLTFTNVEGSDAEGKVKITNNMKKGLNAIEMRLSLMDLPMEQGEVYEAWLVDEDSDYWLSMGGFTPSNSGRANFKFKQYLVNFDIYDKIVVTREDIQDTDPSADEEVLVVSMDDDDDEEPSTPNTFMAHLNSQQETTGSNSSATGHGIFVIDTEANTLSINITIEGLEGTEISAHIHGPAGIGETSSPIRTLSDGNVITEVWHYSQPHEAHIIDGKTYVNVHTTTYPDGEIRGQILAA